MSEQFPEHNYGLNFNTTSAPLISACLDKFAHSLSGLEQDEFWKMDVGDQVDRACWLLAQEGSDTHNPSKLQRSINLRTMYTFYSLERFTIGDKESPTWDYYMPVEDKFWQSVDNSLERSIIHLARNKYKEHVEAPQLLRTSFDTPMLTLPICKLSNTRVAKKVFFGSAGAPISVIYEAQPVDLSDAA